MSMHVGAIYRWQEPEPVQTRRKVAMSSKFRWSVQTTLGAGPGQVMRPEGLTEYRTQVIFSADPKVSWIEEQVGPIACCDRTGQAFKHWLDLRVHYRDGTRLGVAVKPYERAQRPEFRERMACVVAAAVPTVVDRIAIVTERHHDPVTLRNAFLVHGCRRPDPEADQSVADVVAQMGNAPVTLEDPVTASGLGSRAYRALVRLIGQGTLEAINGGLLSHSTSVKRTTVQ